MHLTRTLRVLPGGYRGDYPKPTHRNGVPLHRERPLSPKQQALVEQWSGLPRHAVWKWFCWLPEDVKDELIGAGFVALCEAADRYDPSRGVQFNTFALKWIWGRLMHQYEVNERQTSGQFGETLRGHCLSGQIVSVFDEAGHVATNLETERVQSGLKKLDPRYCYVLKSRFGIDGEPRRSLQEISESLGISKERVRQIEAKAFAKLRGLLAKPKEPRS